MSTDTSQVRLALRREDASVAMGMSDESFDKYVRPTLPVVALGSLRLYPVDGIQRWLREHSTTPEDQLEQARNSHRKQRSESQ